MKIISLEAENYKRLKAIDTLSQRHDARERVRDGKLEQKLQDEFSSRKYTVGSQSEEK